MKKIILITVITILIASGLLIFKKHIVQPSQSSLAKFKIGILQTASHPALDAAKLGFINELKSLLGDQVEFAIYNAQGSVAQAHAIAQKLNANQSLNGFLAIATPAVQALGSLEKKRPIFIAAVTDPHALGLISPDTNICGTKDMINVENSANLILDLVPNAKKVGLLYTSGEHNSIVLAKLMRQALEQKNMNVSDFTVNSDTDMAAMTDLACRKSDVLLCPTDNTVAITIDLINKITKKHHKPLIVSDNLLVSQGALAAQGVDYQKSGEQTAKFAYQVLVNQVKPASLPISPADSRAIYVNQSTLAELNLSLPTKLADQVVLI